MKLLKACIIPFFESFFGRFSARFPYRFLSLFLVSFSLITLVSCREKESTPENIEIQHFVWRGLNAFYLWQDKIPDLSDTRFKNDVELNTYLAGFENPTDLFYSSLSMNDEYPKNPNSTYSWIVEDYIALENSFQSIRLTTGMKIKAVNYADGSAKYYVYVYDVSKGSDADTKGIKRGMLINQVNGTEITKDNINDLFNQASFTVHLADYQQGNPVSNGRTVLLTTSQVTENPIQQAKVITQGSNRIGYLLYNQFSSSFDEALNAEFLNFKNEAITDLIVDLRYNGGGSVQSASYLAQMITGQFTGELFSKQVWNHKVNANFSPDFFNNNFTDKIINKDNQGTIVSEKNIEGLHLNRVYFIVSGNSASASELVINGLKPYIDVKLVGTQTYGKHVGSITLYDSDNFMRTGENLKTSHTWAMQPIVLEIQNKKGENKPNGFIPEVIIQETPNALGILGDSSEPLLAKTIEYITKGVRESVPSKRIFPKSFVWDSSMKNPDYNTMYVDFK
ncbi:S41 family peptidase [Tenacibaculum piscium]|uniref:Tail specific protease domain-containing protein n=1 Tax=Tenacibaculum piscium TaxID=1458515 RepID=A0A2H1YGX5_9FLAO|nr:S41 family peptidase [Tenacibaculum piscium]MBE7630193.1 peptidase S41 [Tenacibaculum piscium]MBE7670948.1 peptidase S41 [Tenacibaculum piscium]MBE7690218.1 peptidase S41 [Tenacibaculum piscium]SOS74746.1 conserved hypothetical protein [Tenacibaculum piscium]